MRCTFRNIDSSHPPSQNDSSFSRFSPFDSTSTQPFFHPPQVASDRFADDYPCIDGMMVNSLPSPENYGKQKGSQLRLYLLGVLFILLFTSSACGPERTTTEQLSPTSQTHSIASIYQGNRDLAEARSQLDVLDVANVNQWLIYTTEEAIRINSNDVETRNLVTLVVDLGLQSGMIMDYARQNDLLTLPIVAELAMDGNQPESAPPINSEDEENQGNQQLVLLPTSSVAIEEKTSTQTSLGNAEPTASSSEQPVLSATVAPQMSESASEAAPVTATPVPTATPNQQPFAKALSGINVRGGPGVNYQIVGALGAGESVELLGKNSAGDWWEISLPSGQQGWIYSPLVETSGNVDAVAVAVNIPTPPPTPIPAPTNPPAPTEPPVELEPVEEAPAPAPSGPDFRVVERRLWDVVENGGRLDGISVTCGEKRQLQVRVLDSSGNLLNGVAVQEIYGAKEIFVTGSQGKGDGTVEFVLGGGQAVKIVRDSDGREVSSEEAHNLSTKPWEIPFDVLIGGRFCTDAASCQSFVDATGCYGHYSWTVVFQRNY